MVRWWWFGPSVDRAEIDRELAVMAAAGLGGVEVAYVYPFAAESGSFGSPGFLADLRHAADTAEWLGLRFDLTLGSGWSFGGPHVTPEHAARQLTWERREIPPGAQQVPICCPWPGDELVAAYVGSGSLQEPPEEVDRLTVADGTIVIPDGAGPRQVLLARSRVTGQNVKRAAVGAEGPIFDHYSATAARQHLREVGDRLLDAVPAHLLGSVFCDSLEVYGSDWTPDLPAEFAARRGYALLPELFRLAVDGPGSTQLRADYHHTLAELYEHHFVVELQAWAAARHVPFRIQGYGTPPALISSYRHADLFEGEGWGWTELTQTRWASSAAHLYGRDVVSSEVWTWVHSPSFRATPADLKGEAHEHLLAGVNQLVGHGWPYSPADAPGIGWFFYAAGALDDRNPWWPAMAPLARYLTRLCWLLRQGSPVTDVVVYVSNQDVLARMGLAVGGSLDAWREARELIGPDLLATVRRGGWDYDLVDDDALAVVAPEDPRPVIVGGAATLSPTGRAWLTQRAAAGRPVLMVDSRAEVPGARSCGVSDLPELLTIAAGPGVRLRPAQTDVGAVRRRTEDAEVYLVVNTGPTVRSCTLVLRDPWTWFQEWDAGTGLTRRAGPVDDGIAVTLQPYEATVIVASDRPSTRSTRVVAGDRDHGRRILLDRGWQVRFEDREDAVEVDLPHVWESDPARLAFSGSAVYTTTVDLPELATAAIVRVDFGTATPVVARRADEAGIRGHSYRVEIDPPVGVVAAVRVNDVDCGVAWAPPYTVDISGAVRAGRNLLEVTVYNLAVNALAHDEHVAKVSAAAEQRYGRRARIQDLDRALEGVRSGLLDVPSVVITETV